MSAELTVRLAAATSLDGKIKQAAAVHARDWISPEDKALFAKLVAQSEVVIAGRKTYRNMQPALDHQQRYLIYTRSPGRYADEAIAGTLSFTDEPPHSLAARLRAEGVQRALLVGGAEINTLFLSANLVDEVLLTIEPIIHGGGRPFVNAGGLNQPLQLLSVTHLNRQGSLLLRYRVGRS